jgi:hypothetical protein
MDQNTDTNQNVNPVVPNMGNRQPGYDPYGHPNEDYYNPQLPSQQGQIGTNLPVQNSQPIHSGVSPEVPARVEQGERFVTPEATGKVESKREVPQSEERPVQPKEEISSEKPEVAPDQKKFESPFRLYGYNVSQKVASLGKTSANTVKGNTAYAKTWLILLLGRLLRVNPNEALETA